MKRMKQSAALLIALPLAVLMMARGHAQTPYAIQMVVGDVKIIAGGKTTAAVVDRVLNGGDTIVTGKNAMADVSFGDRGLVRVQEASKVTVATLKKTADDPDLDLDGGSILVMLSKLVKGESYQVRTNTQVASVRGTNFQVSSDREESRVDVLDGRILVNPVADGAVKKEIQEYLSENQSISLNRGAVREILARRRQMKAAALGDRDIDGLLDRFSKIRESRGFKKMNRAFRGEFEERIMKMRERRAQRHQNKQMKKKVIKERVKQRRSSTR